MSIKAINIKKILITLLWIVIGVGTVLLSVAAMKRQGELLCKGVEVDITGVNNNFFIDESDVKKIIGDFTGKRAEGTPVSEFNLRQIEAAIEKDVWVDNAELFFDRNGILQVSVEEREPVARIFTKGGNTFYIDSATMMLPMSDKFSARLPVFTGFMSEGKVLLPADSALLLDIKKISMAIQADSFLMAMIDQVDITAERNFEMTPKIGDQQIILGDGSDIESKFTKLKLFYKKVITTSGWNRYSIINLQYKNQVVAKLKGKEDVAQDSLKTLQLMNYMAINAAIQAADSLRVAAPGNDNTTVDASLIQQSVQRDDEGIEGDDETNVANPVIAPVTPVTAPVNAPKPVTATVAKAAVTKPAAKPVSKPADKKPAVKAKPVIKKATTPAKPVQKPKAVMQNKNDY